MCEMWDLFVSTDMTHDRGFDSTYWQANLFLIAAKDALQNPATQGFGKKANGKVWENTEFWRTYLPTWFAEAVPQRFMRLLQSMDIPEVALFPGID